MKPLESSATEIQTLLRQGLGPGLHWFPGDVPAARLAAVLAGMANTDGGNVLMGVSPRSGQVQGLFDPAEALDCALQAALLTYPPLVIPLPRLHTVNRLQVLCITVPSGLPHVYSLDGRYLGREGEQTNPLSARRLRLLLLERGVVQFESQIPPDATLDDLDEQKVAAYIRALRWPVDESWQEILLRRGCLRRDEHQSKAGEILSLGPLRPTYAALLLFGKHPQRWLPNATILAARFSGSTLADKFIKQDIAGTLPEQLRLAQAFVQENLHSVVRIVGLARQETTEYPPEALRELLVNAIAHRDYNVQGDNIHLNLFADRIEVHSPGGLPGPVNLLNLLEARFSRNVVIVQALSDLGFVERLGYGLNRVVEVMRQHHLRSPRFEESSGAFRVTLYGDLLAGSAVLPDLAAYQEMGLNPRQEAALTFLVHHRRITSRDFQDLCPDVHTETLRRDLVDLVSKGILIKVGDKRATYYILKR